MHPNYRGLAFLLSLGSLPIACNDKGDETDGTLSTDPTANTGTSTGTAGTDATDPTTGPTGPTTTDATTTTDPSTTTTGPTGGMDTGTSEVAPTTTNSSVDSGDTEMLPPPTDPNCIAYAAHLAECFPRSAPYQEYYAQQCELYKGYGLRADGQPCADAFDALYVCLSKAKCGDIEGGGACEKEGAKLSEACPSLGEGMTTSDSSSGSSG